jgi:uncharacterized membrane protein
MMGYGRGLGYGYGHFGGGAPFGGLLFLLFGALFIAGVVVLIVWAVRSSRHHAVAPGTPAVTAIGASDEAIAIAKRRLASGEITVEEYDTILKVLGG